jgi:hypothetical protein
LRQLAQPACNPNVNPTKKAVFNANLGSCCYKLLCTQQLLKEKIKKANLLQTKCYIAILHKGKIEKELACQVRAKARLGMKA